ncbi:MAG TPA: SWIM zinc finger family protein [Ktedonobacteraceae bacterium]|nr:SWIM zinc finger family protein [Ktedonobacteraceae bacterium]
MKQFGRNWWGERFIAALERFTDAGRLGRGRSYASNGRIISYEISQSAVTAKVRGSVNPYYGIMTAPTYKTTIIFRTISPSHWKQVISKLSSRADMVTQLLMGEMPATIEDVFAELDLYLLPHSARDFESDCSCPDYANPCKHIAGLYYVLAAALDQDPFVIFGLRGLTREDLQAELAKTSLGKILADSLVKEEIEPEPVASYFTRPIRESDETDSANHKEFWSGARRLPPLPAIPTKSSVPAILVKKQGDFPPFWPKAASFIRVMEEIYERVRIRNPQMK